MSRDYRKLKTLEDYHTLDAPKEIPVEFTPKFENETFILRMLLRPKYGNWVIPPNLNHLKPLVTALDYHDYGLTGITDKWCYLTVRHGTSLCQTDDEWHFDGSSFRTEIIPERNYVWVSHTPIQYKQGGLKIPEGFDPLKHNLFHLAEDQTRGNPILEADAQKWWLFNPFCLHRRNPVVESGIRTFVRVSFIDIEVRDAMCTQNPLFQTEAYGRNPVKSFRDNLTDYPLQ